MGDILIITTIIHELAHYLLTEILEQIMMKILNTNKTPLIESFVCLLLQEDLWFLLDEFCAHTVEGRFAPYNYQDYGSYEYRSHIISPLYLVILIKIENNQKNLKKTFKRVLTSEKKCCIIDRLYA